MSPSCEAVLAALGKGPLPPELAAHAQGCPDCQAAMRVHEALGRLPPDSVNAAALAKAKARADAELTRSARAAPWWSSALVLVLAGAAVIAIGVLRMAPNNVSVDPAPKPLFWMVSAWIGLGLVLGAIASVSPRTKRIGWSSLAIAATAGLAVLLTGSGDSRGMPFLAGAHCCAAEVALSVVPLVATLWVLAGSAFRPLRAFAAGVAAGAAGIFTLHLHCTNGTWTHLLTFHLVPWLAIGALVVAIRSRLPSRSFAP